MADLDLALSIDFAIPTNHGYFAKVVQQASCYLMKLDIAYGHFQHHDWTT